MAIPPLVSGLLPPGIYNASLTEVWATFDQAASLTRPALSHALEHAVVAETPLLQFMSTAAMSLTKSILLTLTWP